MPVVKEIAHRIKASRAKGNEKEKKEDTDGPSDSKGASGGNDEKDSNRNLNSANSTGASGGNDEKDFNRNIYSGNINRSQLLQQPLRENISSNGKSIDRSSQREGLERRRCSLPSNSPQEVQVGPLWHPKSEPLLSQMNQTRKLKLGDPLATSVLNKLELLEGLGKNLDKEYKCGEEIKCWKHLSEYFGVDAGTYEDFTRSQERSPTEDLFEILKTRKPEEFTVGKLKDKLSSIGRRDVQDVLSKFADDDIRVGSLFDTDPQVIAKMAFLLDKEKPGKRNWKYLADMFGVARTESQYFGESIDENPTKYLIEHLCVKKPRLTIREVKEHLKILKMQEVLDVLAESKKVKDNSPLKDLWEDLDIAARVCSLLNKKHTSLIRCWRHLGNKLGVKKDTLDAFSKEGEMISPTQVLIDHLGATKPSLTMAHLILALDRIGRSDVVLMVELYFPDGEISKFLESERAKIRTDCYRNWKAKSWPKFNLSCLSSDGCCSICKESLEQLIIGESSDSEAEDDTATVVNSETRNATAKQYHTSELWEQKVTNSLSASGEIDQPQHPNTHISYAHTQSQSSEVQITSIVQQLSVSPTTSNTITSWHFPSQYSQSTLNGRQGSTACTFIALTYSNLYFSSPEPLDSSRPLSNTWLSRVLEAIRLGNQCYDRAAGNSGQLYGVREAATIMEHTKDLENIDVSEEFPASIIREQTPSASLPYYLNQAQANNTKTACIFIINDKTVAFIPTQNGITVFDSHYHGTSGAFVAMAPSDAAFELLSWFKTINSIPHDLGTVTCVSFR